MTTSILTPSQAPRHSTVRKLSIFAFLLLLAAIFAVLAYLYSIAHAALPQLDGTLKIPGLTAKVTVTRDAHGVPTIDAASLDDLFFAQGYVTAQDRLWQMDAMRLYAAGELSEILGPSQLARDREQRILGLRAVAHHSVELASARDREFMQAYARGVNAYRQSHSAHLPIEFRILDYQPKPWTVEDSVLMGVNMVKDLNHGYYRAALQKEKILARLGPELTADLYVNSSWHDRPPMKAPIRMDDLQDEDSDAPDDNDVTQISPPFTAVGAIPDSLDLVRLGSNNWVVSGAHTVLGKPLLSNDMHLNHQMPNLWYEVHLRAAGLDVVGVSLPGMPFVIVGHNQRIAWGFTNVGPTVEDVYLETFNDRGQYRTPQGWRDPQHRRETIHVKGAPDQVVDVSVTRHGPVITELIPGETRQIALRWTLYDGVHNPFFDIDTAQNWADFTHALSAWDAPAQNAVYADLDGHIGYHATGNIPIRASGDGSLLEDGSNDDHEWKSFVPFDKLPNVYDPPWGVIATANGRITLDNYPYSLATDWDAPWRTERIYHVLESGKKFTPADMLALQTDVYSAFDRFCAERFVYALDHAPRLSARARQARDLMRDWDGRLTKASAAATIEHSSREHLTRLLLEPKLGASTNEEGGLSWRNYHWFMSSVWLESVLLKQPKRWLPPNYSDYDAVLVAAVEASVKIAPADLNGWRWGKAYPLDIQHPVLGRVPLINRWTGPGVVEQAGGAFTVKQSTPELGPSERMTVDFSDLDQSTLNLVTGQAGNFLSPYYMDQWKAWYDGTTFTVPFSSAAVERTRRHRLVLEP
ncbi:MAG TPA: penicillin acylase family protein [Terriglobales bacterium]|nr:penicillin acylase family protein [Terriglobales bacterium]